MRILIRTAWTIIIGKGSYWENAVMPPKKAIILPKSGKYQESFLQESGKVDCKKEVFTFEQSLIYMILVYALYFTQMDSI